MRVIYERFFSAECRSRHLGARIIPKDVLYSTNDHIKFLRTQTGAKRRINYKTAAIRINYVNAMAQEV